METFIDNEAGYREWVKANPTGYVLNLHREPQPIYLILHRADCHTINPERAPKTQNWTGDYVKKCSSDRRGFQEWADQRFGKGNHDLRPCWFCQKAGRV